MVETTRADDGASLWTRRTGSGTPLVLCHGGPGLWDYFDEPAALLAGDFTVVQWDQRGCGRSPSPGPYTIEQSVADLHAVVRGTCPSPVAVLGHSWGGLLALRYALAHPEHVSHLVYVSGVGVDPTATWLGDFLAAARARIGPRLPRFDELYGRERTAPEEREFAVLQWSADFTEPASAFALAERLATPFRGINRACHAALTRQTDEYVDSGAALTAIAAVRTPTLIIDGAHDIRPRRAVDSLVRALPRATRITLDTGHNPWAEQPAAFAAAVRDFLLRDPLSPPGAR
ncbi:proline iminopeptidase [Catellatospora methionotrophica]|uniref:Proline iminopeptidase n=1 Tax=Catellatospora methionotrophica TaxID=121620 RepID=A0A8J3LE68_9ACTN|nr:alpha/beta hydrolase [Catellatospora methionotrophica]GIG17009.1 proline iminopeptidase [Catellatospora methionotrophica]